MPIWKITYDTVPEDDLPATFGWSHIFIGDFDQLQIEMDLMKINGCCNMRYEEVPSYADL